MPKMQNQYFISFFIPVSHSSNLLGLKLLNQIHFRQGEHKKNWINFFIASIFDFWGFPFFPFPIHRQSIWIYIITNWGHITILVSNFGNYLFDIIKYANASHKSTWMWSFAAANICSSTAFVPWSWPLGCR